LEIMREPNENFDENLQAPPAFVSALRELPQEKIFVPPTLDEAVLNAARKHLEGEDKRRTGWFRFMPWAVAVALLAVVLLLSGVFTSHLAKQRISPFAREDINHDGQVDILMRLRSRSRSGRSPARHHDST
jgi:hypothetical protein